MTSMEIYSQYFLDFEMYAKALYADATSCDIKHNIHLADIKMN